MNRARLGFLLGFIDSCRMAKPSNWSKFILSGILRRFEGGECAFLAGGLQILSFRSKGASGSTWYA